MNRLSAQNEKPSIFDFVDIGQFLNAIYEFRKKSELNFSYASWAQDIGLQSRTFLKLIVVGKRSITMRSLPLFIRGFQLNEAEAKYFEVLVRLSRANSIEERHNCMNELYSFRGSKKRKNSTLVLDHYHFLSNPLGPRIQGLLSVDSSTYWSAQAISDCLQSKKQHVSEILSHLKAIDLVEERQDESGTPIFCSKTSDFEIQDHLGSLALQSFHRKSLKEAINLIEMEPKHRRFQAAFIPLNLDELQELQERIQLFVEELLQRYNRVHQDSRLYQVNLNAIPISQPVLQTRCLSASAGAQQADVQDAIHFAQESKYENH